MSRMRKLIGFWIVLIIYVSIPVAYYLVVTLGDRALGLPMVIPQWLNAFLAAISVFAGLFWTTWGYSYLHLVGKGSPAEVFGVALLPTEQLVTTGPYAYTRNPMLIGMLFILLGGAFYTNSIFGVVLIPVLALVAMLYISRFEEPALVRRFGKRYEDYRDAVPALIPSVRPKV